MTSNSNEQLAAALERACKKIAPLWPLERFVAVNPYLGLTDHTFESTAQQLRNLAGIHTTMSLPYYLQALSQGKMTLKDVEAALERRSGEPKQSAEAFVLQLQEAAKQTEDVEQLQTVADVLGTAKRADWNGFMTDRVSVWAASYFDKGQSSWRAAASGASLFAAWKLEASTDRSPALMGLKGFRSLMSDMSDEPVEAAQQALAHLAVPEDALDAYLHSLLLRLPGWSAYIAHLDWELRRDTGSEAAVLPAFLSVMLCWEYGLLRCLGNAENKALWETAKEKARALNNQQPIDIDLQHKLVMQDALDLAAQRKMVGNFKKRSAVAAAGPAQPAVQAVFCIDVRSEVYRRNLEMAAPEVETIGFAGFFGFPIKYVRMGYKTSSNHCPVLIPAGPTVLEKMADDAENTAILRLKGRTRLVNQAWKTFRSSAVTCFGFVSPIGISYLPKLFSDSFRLTRPVPHPEKIGFTDAQRLRMGVDASEQQLEGETVGMLLDERVQMAKSALTAMSLTEGFARLVLLTGHGSSSVNNPHASGLDCGACAGQSGEANARVAAAVLNEAAVRAKLAEQGLQIPSTTWFMAGLHDTTTDEVRLFNTALVPASHQEDLSRLEQRLQRASVSTALERGLRLDLVEDGTDVNQALLARSKDWAQLRPEWGLAGCAAFIAAPRRFTTPIDLEGRSFLHSYEWKKDQGFKVLEVIMTAPLVVASWINLQYFGSTVDNKSFGAGNKTLHNVTGGLGVLEGYGGDLRGGLPLQSIHNGKDFQYEPLRLTVLINAPMHAINGVLEQHAGVRKLFDNRWIFLYALDEEGQVSHRYGGDLTWEEVASAGVTDGLPAGQAQTAS